MNLEAEIELITVPQEFTRLCNAVLIERFGEDFLPIDDDRADRGNDGYRKSTREVFAVHCFKRIQKQKITDEIRRKMIGDLGKAKILKQQGLWDIEKWTFLCNYSIPEEVGREVVNLGSASEIEVSWLGPAFLSACLQHSRELRDSFPSLQANEVSEQIADLRATLIEPATPAPDRVPRMRSELEAVLDSRPGGWEYLLFAGRLFIGKQDLEMRWRDHEIPPYSEKRDMGSVADANAYLGAVFGRVTGLVEALMGVFPEEIQEAAFGAPGEAGDPIRIEHFAIRILETYGELLEWAAEFRTLDPPELLAPSFEAASKMADQPISELRNFIDNVVHEIDRVPSYLENHSAGDPPLKVELALQLTIDEKVNVELHRQLRRARRKIRWGV